MTLREWCKAGGYSQAEFAVMVGSVQSTVSRWSAGMDVPNPTAMQKIYDVTGGKVSPNDFILAAAK